MSLTINIYVFYSYYYIWKRLCSGKEEMLFAVILYQSSKVINDRYTYLTP